MFLIEEKIFFPWTSPDFGPFGTECGNLRSHIWKVLTILKSLFACIENNFER
jgi:hypothetical protein